MRKSAFILVLFMIFLSGCVSRLNNENLSKIKNGMSEHDVEAVLGKPDHSDVGQSIFIKGTTYYYKSGNNQVKIVFWNDSVMAIDGHFE